MSIVFTKDFQVKCPSDRRTWRQIACQIGDLSLPGIPIRIVLTSVQEEELTFECSFIQTKKTPVWPSLLDINIRQAASAKPFVAVSIIPTGVRAEIGGFAGDATPSTNLLSTACDYLITNPNAVTASDLYYANDNVLYLEGNLICHLLLGHIGLVPEKRKNIGVIIENHENELIINNVLNALNALRSVGGINIDPVIISGGRIETECTYSSYGHASGKFSGIDELMRALDIIETTETSAVGVVTTLLVDDAIRQQYYRGDAIPNPWGGAEAILTHMTTNFYPFTAAHAPLLIEWKHSMFGTLGDVRDGAELISSAYVCSPLKGLINSPRPVRIDTPLPEGSQRISVENISAVVMPETTVGNIPFLASLDQNIPVILVRGNPTQCKITPALLQINEKERKIYYANTYTEAAGLLLALRHGIVPETTTRPLAPIKPLLLDNSNFYEY
ncbi:MULTISPECIES: DUF3326 domain-containing protein [Aerosakkonema]|uniref:DUF3326 domain-containing protein n=1 Tax=Aerosakkonema TaxID=1246629 RepID=UPI0035BA95EB